MVEWHERTRAKVGLRLAGLALLGTGWALGHLLAGLVRGFPHEATPAEFLIGAVLFICSSAGMALTIFGDGLFKQVRISARWANQIPPVLDHDDPSGPRDQP